jgi:hypothetical protein
MPSPALTASPKPANALQVVIDTARQGGDQALAVYRHVVRFGLDAAGMWFETVSALIPGRIPPAAVTDVLAQYATATSDVAEKAVQVQRELVAQAIDLLRSP